MITSEREVQWVGVYPTVRSNGISRITGGLHLCLPLPEHSRTFHCDQANYGTVSGGGAVYGVKGGQVVAVTGRLGLVQDMDGGPRGRMDGGGGGDGWGSDGDGINRWEDTVKT